MGLLPSPPIEVVAGRAFFEGQDLLGLAPRRMGTIRGDRIAMIFQEPLTSLNPVYSIGDQTAQVELRHRAVSSSEARAGARALLYPVKITAPDTTPAQNPPHT